MSDTPPAVVNVEDAEETTMKRGGIGGSWKVLTPSMRPRGGALGVVRMRLSPGHATVPFHWHAREDEVFFILSGRGVLRYGDDLSELRPGDCVSCPAGTRNAHQIANPFDEDLLYLAIGPYDPDEVCGYPDSGKILVRSARRVGFMNDADYMAGEPERPRAIDLWEERSKG